MYAYTFVDEEIGEILIGFHGIITVRYIFSFNPFIGVLFRMELYSIERHTDVL